MSISVVAYYEKAINGASMDIRVIVLTPKYKKKLLKLIMNC